MQLAFYLVDPPAQFGGCYCLFGGTSYQNGLLKVLLLPFMDCLL